MNQKISNFHLDAENHWVADLECGHKQHVRHDPPLVERPWVLTEEGRHQHLGTSLNCVRCDEFGLVVAKAIQTACLKAVESSFSETTFCKEGQLELALDQIQNLDIDTLTKEAIIQATTKWGVLS